MFKLIPARYVFHRRSWMFGGMTLCKAQNLAKVAFAYATKSEKVGGLPPIFKTELRITHTLDRPCTLLFAGLSSRIE